ncbi:MAG: DUF2007 domain-containing protein [Xanthomonadales bacterium]|nr:DUF2007 domain-containing protein [Xanthomonadales bacterium]MCE7932658.1 DUF2007 domain-containing protein [Xanthomonadales bacterium PRO6]
MRTVYEAENLFDAQWVKDALEAAGIPAFIAGAALTGGIGELPVIGLVTVQVPDGAATAASRIVAEFDRMLAEPPVEPFADGAEPVPAV